MGRERILNMLKLDKKFIKELIIHNGGLGAIEILKECYKDTPITSRIPDPTLSLMIWNTMLSIGRLEEITEKHYTCVESIEHYAQTLDKKDPNRTIAHHIVCGLYNLQVYVT